LSVPTIDPIRASEQFLASALHFTALKTRLVLVRYWLGAGRFAAYWFFLL
jgi:hypothetical protein